MPEGGKSDGRKGMPEQFAASLEPLARQIVEQLQVVADEKGEAEEAQIVRGFGPLFTETVAQTADLLQRALASADESDLRASEEMLRAMGSETMVAQANEMSRNVTSFAGRFGLQNVFQLIKKLVKWLFDVLNIGKKWIVDLLELIDEILDALLGGGNPKAMRAFSQREQDYMAELTALANYKAALLRTDQLRNSEEEF